MKAICIKQPYADLILKGKKTIELRSWKTNYRGKVRVCVSASPKKTGLPAGVELCDIEIIDITKFEKNHEKSACHEWRDGLYSWHIKLIKPVKQKPIKGRLGLFDLKKQRQKNENSHTI